MLPTGSGMLASSTWTQGCIMLCRYKRVDGVDLTATLYTPPGYDRARDGPLPCILWAYPREFKSKVQTHFSSAHGQNPARCASVPMMHAVLRQGSRCYVTAVQDAAGQLRQSPHQFSGVSAMSPLLWLARRYAILVSS